MSEKCNKCQNELPNKGYYRKKLEYDDENRSWKYEKICKSCMEKAIETKEIWDIATVISDDWFVEVDAGETFLWSCKCCNKLMPKIRQHEEKDGKVIKLKHNCKTNDEEIKKLQGKGNDNQERERERESKVETRDCWFRSNY